MIRLLTEQKPAIYLSKYFISSKFMAKLLIVIQTTT